MSRSPHPIWLLLLVPPIRFGRTTYAVVVLVLLLTLCQLAGVFEPRPTRITSQSATVFFAVLLAYIVPVLHVIVARSEEAFSDLARHLDAPEAHIDRWRESIRLRPFGRQLTTAFGGLAAGIAHNAVLAQPHSILDVFMTSPADAAVVVGTLLVWLVMTTVILTLIDIARLFARLARHVRIDLLQPRSLTPFARVAVISTLALIGAQAAFPIMWIGADDLTPLASLPGLIATSLPMVFLFAMPLLPIHYAITTAKAAELRRLDDEIASIPKPRHDGDDEARMRVLLPLLVYRREIESAHEWPFDTSVVSRLAVYLVIPPLTWVGAALIEHFVEGAL